MEAPPPGLDSQDVFSLSGPNDAFDLDIFLDGGPDGSFNIFYPSGQLPFPGMDFSVASPILPGHGTDATPSSNEAVSNAMAAIWAIQ